MSAVDYREYINGQDWRARRRTYLAKFPFCRRCGMGMEEHKERFDTSLHVHHISYTRLGAELDEDLETLCKPCHLREETRQSDPDDLIGDYWFLKFGVGEPKPARPVSALSSDDSTIDLASPPEVYWSEALERIAKRIKIIGKREPTEEMWKELERMHKLEELATFCLEYPKIEREPGEDAAP
jgi:hypothetical protein